MRSKEIERIRKQNIIITAKLLICTHHGSFSICLVTYYISHIYIPAYSTNKMIITMRYFSIYLQF